MSSTELGGRTDLTVVAAAEYGGGRGHLYDAIGQLRGLRASHQWVVGIPGDDIQPPVETFGVNDYRTVGSLWTDVEVDGAGVGASGLGMNSLRDITLCRVVSHDNVRATGFASWQSSGIRLVNCVARDNGFSGFNFERVSGSTMLMLPEPLATGTPCVSPRILRAAASRSSIRS